MIGHNFEEFTKKIMDLCDAEAEKASCQKISLIASIGCVTSSIFEHSKKETGKEKTEKIFRVYITGLEKAFEKECTDQTNTLLA